MGLFLNWGGVCGGGGGWDRANLQLKKKFYYFFVYMQYSPMCTNTLIFRLFYFLGKCGIFNLDVYSLS